MYVTSGSNWIAFPRTQSQFFSTMDEFTSAVPVALSQECCITLDTLEVVEMAAAELDMFYAFLNVLQIRNTRCYRTKMLFLPFVQFASLSKCL